MERAKSQNRNAGKKKPNRKAATKQTNMSPSRGELVRILEADNDDGDFDFIPCHWNHDDPDAQARAERTLRYTTPSPLCRRFSRTPPGTTISALEIRDRDVLLGRSRSLSLYVGNKRLRDEVYSDYEKYHSASKKEEKTEIAKQIFETVIMSGGRFLKRSPNDKLPPKETSWIVAEDEEGREKVSNVFRNFNKQKKRKSNCKMHEESTKNSLQEESRSHALCPREPLG
mmetsp:Transcript_11395/g.28808  ORF Transcript_11395/g.28808 Transcript_11395/m.28808 type:complete len:228 (+) Transcript_11395:122-805(+)